MGVYEQVKQALQDIVSPGLKAIEVEIKRLDEKIDSIKTEMSTEFKRVDERMGSLKAEITTEIKRLDEKIDIAINLRERLIAIETELGLRKREPKKRTKSGNRRNKNQKILQ